MSATRHLRSGLLAATCALVAAHARAEVSYSAPAQCPNTPTFQARLRSLLPKDSAEPQASITIVNDGKSFVSDIELLRPSAGRRTLKGEDCALVADGSALIVSMSVGGRPDALENAPPPSVVQPVPDGPPAKAPFRRFGIAPHFGLQNGSLPSLAPGFGASLSVYLVPRVALEVDGTYWLPNDALVSDAARSNVGATFHLVTSSVRGCVSFGSTLSIATCAGVELSVLSGAAFGADHISTTDTTSVTWGPQLGLIVQWRSGLFGLRLGAFASAPLSRRAFKIDGEPDLYVPEIIAVRGFFGPELRF